MFSGMTFCYRHVMPEETSMKNEIRCGWAVNNLSEPGKAPIHIERDSLKVIQSASVPPASGHLDEKEESHAIQQKAQ